VHFLQIWVVPEARKSLPATSRSILQGRPARKLTLVASRDGANGAVVVHQDVKLLAGLFSAGESASYALGAGRHAWLHVARGKVRVNGQELSAGDAVQPAKRPPSS